MKSGFLKNISDKNGGVIQTSQAIEAGISKTYFLKFVKENGYEKVTRGIYIAPDAWKDSLYLLAIRYPGMIYSHKVALYLQDMTDHEPSVFTATVPFGYNASGQKKDGMRIYTVKKEWYTIGLTTADTNFGHSVKVYSPERTLCDIFRTHSDIESQDKYTALKEYVSRTNRDIPCLMQYAALFHIEKLIRQYLEVLL